MPALGDHITIEIDEIEKPVRAYMFAIPISAQKTFNNSNLQQKTRMTSKHDMFRYGLIHFDMHHRYSIDYVFELSPLQQALQLQH